MKRDSPKNQGTHYFGYQLYHLAFSQLLSVHAKDKSGLIDGDISRTPAFETTLTNSNLTLLKIVEW